MNILVDTSVWSLSLRRRSAYLNSAERIIVQELAELIGEGRARLIGLIRQEVLSGVRNAEQFEKLRTYLRAFPDEGIESLDHENAAEMSNKCQARGITVCVVDALICSIAAGRDWAIFTTDADFEHHGKVLSIKLHTPRT